MLYSSLLSPIPVNKNIFLKWEKSPNKINLKREKSFSKIRVARPSYNSIFQRRPRKWFKYRIKFREDSSNNSHFGKNQGLAQEKTSLFIEKNLEPKQYNSKLWNTWQISFSKEMCFLIFKGLQLHFQYQNTHKIKYPINITSIASNIKHISNQGKN